MKNSIGILLVFLTPIFSFPQNKLSVERDNISEIERWKGIRKRLEIAVNKGDITKEEADKRYQNYRAHVSGKKIEHKDLVLENHFLKLGVNDISEIKNNLLDQEILVAQLDSVLGGLLRLIYQFKTDSELAQINPRLQNYFRDRIGLTHIQINYLINLARVIASGSYPY